MKNQPNRPPRVLVRALVTASAGAIVMLSQTSCGGLGLGKSGEDDDMALIDPPRKNRGTLFQRSKNRNAWIDSNAQTTRRDRYAAQNNTTFAAPTEAASDRMNPAQPGPLTPNTALNPDPDPTIISPPDAATRQQETEAPFRLPTLDSDFPQPNSPSAAADSFPTPNRSNTTSRSNEDEGYIPLQPKLPGAESIVPPRD